MVVCGWPAQPGISRRKTSSIPAVTGSRSLKAVRKGFVQCDRASYALRFAGVTASVLCAHGLSGATEPGTEPAALTLRDALERVAVGNVDLRRQNIALRASAANVVASEGAFDFVLGADGTLARRVSPQIGPTQPLTLINSELFDLSLARPLESGGKLTLAASGQKATTVVTGATSAPLYSSNVNLTFTQPLLQGFGREIAEPDLRSLGDDRTGAPYAMFVEMSEARLGRHFVTIGGLANEFTGSASIVDLAAGDIVWFNYERTGAVGTEPDALATVTRLLRDLPF
jgi:hypothetical protein